MNLVGAVIAFVVGCGISVLSWSVTYAKMKSAEDASGVMQITMLRQAINIGLLVIIFLLSSVLPFSLEWMLTGAALGLTLPTAFNVAKINNNKKSKETAKEVR